MSRTPRLALATAALLAATVTTGVAFGQEVKLETEADKLNYSLGMMIGEQLKSQFGDVDHEMLLEGIKAQQSGGDTLLTVEEAQQLLQAKQTEMAEVRAEAARAASESFLAENKAREEVSVTESGLQYEVLSEGDGEKPTIEDEVTVHYVGTLTDGTQFDSSIDRGEPTTFPLKSVIPGWTEGLQLMEVGSKYRFVIPADLAYGDRGAGQAIGPGETLIFEVELLEIAE